MKTLFIALGISINIFGQNSSKSFEIKGVVKPSVTKADSIYLEPAFIDTSFYENKSFISKIENNNFTFTGKISYPIGLFLSFQNSNGGYAMTQMILVDKGNHTLSIDEFIPNKYYNLSNSEINTELNKKFLPQYYKILQDEELAVEDKNIVQEKDYKKIRREFNEKKIQYLLDYTKKYPNSYISLWFAIERYSVIGYNDKFLDIYNYLSPKIKKTSTAKVFIKKLNEKNFEDKITKISLKDYNDVKKNGYNLDTKYTLVDFWFSNCGPCLIEMPKYKELYSKYKRRSFEIIGISTDRTSNKGNWRKVIKEKELIWRQYLDENGTEAKKYNINKFPTTFLLDSEGKIIKKDISPEELEQFLEENLKN